MLLIAGPCQIESRDHCLMMAEQLLQAVDGLPIEFVFKASYDKANRTSLTSPRGVGMMEGRRILSEVASRFGCQTLTDVHSVAEAQCMTTSVLQIPALLCRQTDLLVTAGREGQAVNIKKGQVCSTKQMRHAVSKVRWRQFVGREVWVTERGSFFGYGDLVVDFRSLVELRSSGADKVIFDASHSVQRPGAGGDKSLGDRQFIEPLARAALAVGVDGLFIECHDEPEQAMSDGDIAFPLRDFRGLMERLLKVWDIGKTYRHSS